ncbi:MAG TPA: hypothetical protein VLI05_01075 [Candidatus Saccharimonadia bacterium]|nr:hypothetical protein [Candidatus Saccharimonadia bacterium]
MNVKRPREGGMAPLWAGAQRLVQLADGYGGYRLAQRAAVGRLLRLDLDCRIAALTMVADGTAAELTPRGKVGVILSIDFMWVSCTGVISLWAETPGGRSTPEMPPLLRLEPPDNPDFKLAMWLILDELGIRRVSHMEAVAYTQLGWDGWAMKCSHRLSQTGLSHIVRPSEQEALLVFRNGQTMSLSIITLNPGSPMLELRPGP